MIEFYLLATRSTSHFVGLRDIWHSRLCSSFYKISDSSSFLLIDMLAPGIDRLTKRSMIQIPSGPTCTINPFRASGNRNYLACECSIIIIDRHMAVYAAILSVKDNALQLLLLYVWLRINSTPSTKTNRDPVSTHLTNVLRKDLVRRWSSGFPPPKGLTSTRRGRWLVTVVHNSDTIANVKRIVWKRSSLLLRHHSKHRRSMHCVGASMLRLGRQDRFALQLQPTAAWPA